MTDGSSTWSFTYDANGMRTSRSNGSRTYKYIYNGGSLSQLTVDGHTLRFTYDASGSPLSINYDGTEYYYVLNLQGDVRAILDSSGNEVVTYYYDAWGNIRWAVHGSMQDTLGFYNPLCYRGYVYDSETGLYYLQSRYYDPEICRFLNADTLVSTGQGLLGNNMFAYCRNNPVIRRDASGTEDVCVTDFNEDNNPLNDLGSPSGGGGGGRGLGVKSSYYTAQRVRAYDWHWQNSSYNQSPTSLSENTVSIPQEAKDTLEHVDQKGCAPKGYKGGKIFQNDGRNGSQKLPTSGMPYREYDIYPHNKGVPRGTERIVVGADNSAWYTNDHYVSFVRMR